MKEKIIFTPILKTKATAEPTVIEKCLDIFSDTIIPYLEIKDTEKSGYTKCIELLNNVLHFEQLYRKEDITLSDCIEYAKIRTNNKIIPSIHLLDDDKTTITQLKEYIDTCHQNKQSCAIRLQVGFNVNSILTAFGNLNKNDYIIIDIEEGDYLSSKPYIQSIADNTTTKILIFSTDRNSNTPNKDYNEFGYSTQYNNKIINYIKNNKFHEDGFGTFCTAKNDLNEKFFPCKTYGLFIIYDYSYGGIFTIRTNKRKIAASAYSDLKILFSDKTIMNEITNRMKGTPISYSMLTDFLDNKRKKGSSALYIGISITHYIEEISNNM